MKKTLIYFLFLLSNISSTSIYNFHYTSLISPFFSRMQSVINFFELIIEIILVIKSNKISGKNRRTVHANANMTSLKTGKFLHSLGGIFILSEES